MYTILLSQISRTGNGFKKNMSFSDKRGPIRAIGAVMRYTHNKPYKYKPFQVCPYCAPSYFLLAVKWRHSALVIVLSLTDIEFK